MAIKFGEIKSVRQTQRRPKVGSFAPPLPELKWESCRENFSKVMKKLNGFYFSHDPGKAVAIATFLNKIENVLQISQKTKYSKTNLVFVLWIEPASFWMSCDMRLQLLTILLRCGMNYNVKQDNFEEALLGNHYISQTKRAVYRFLFGFTKYIGTQQVNGVGKGWVRVFGRKSDDYIKQKLVRPRRQKVSLIGAGELWS